MEINPDYNNVTVVYRKPRKPKLTKKQQAALFSALMWQRLAEAKYCENKSLVDWKTIDYYEEIRDGFLMEAIGLTFKDLQNAKKSIQEDK